MNNPYPQGSIWRRWDLHAHTPDSFENSFGGWEPYLAALHAVSGVSVLGVTDYFLIDGYRKLRARRAAGELTNFDLILPNIELRLGTFVPKRSDGSQLRRLNFHVIFSDDLEPDLIEQQFIQALHFQIEGHTEDERGARNVTRQSIEEAGRLVRKHQQTFAQDSDFVAGCKVITFDLNEARKVLQKACFTGKYLLFLAAENWDHIDWGGQDYLVRKNLLQSAHGLFCGQRNTIEWCLGRHGEVMTPAKFIEEFGALKPCIHGSDAHKIAALCKPLDDKFCWIKADPTFEGLRQLVYEPADRVHIGPSAPAYHDEARVIRSITLSSTGGWFEEVEIPLNPGLVSIIGQKGSGKSALAEVIARAANSWEADEKGGSFIERASPLIDDLSVRLRWTDDTTTDTRLGDEQTGEKRVRYLSQKFVERLCADDHIGADLIREIESVIFACTDPTDTLNASDFAELRAIRTEGIREESQRLRGDIIRLIREECGLRDNAKKLEEKKSRIKTLQEEEAGLVKQMPAAASPEEAKVRAELQEKRITLAAAQQAVALEKQRLQKVTDIRTRVAAFKSQITRFVSEVDLLLENAGVPDADRTAFHPAFPADTEAPLARRTDALQGRIAKLEGAKEKPEENTVNWLLAKIAELTTKESADKARQDKIKTIQTRIAAIGTEVKRIEGEVSQIEGPEKQRIAAAYQERLQAYVAYFRNLKLEHEALQALYLPVHKKMQSESATTQEQELEFSIRWEADLKTWLKRGSELFDQRTSIPYGNFEQLTNAARSILLPAWTSGNPEKIQPALEQFLLEFKKRELRPKEYLRSEITHQDLIEWLYEVGHIRLSYGLKYNTVELEKLSPGTKGIVLLILYLGMDTVDTRPLIVDQPDENLDNESIYRLLTRYFKDAKTRRQIILITHNPNLVVNADSEQVIVATCDRRANGLPHIAYYSGALENVLPEDKGIRQQACRILEGGSDAFLKREQRYALLERL